MEDKKFELIRKWKEKIILDIIKNSSLTSSKKKEALIKEFALNKKVDVF